jgi:hypothetical protein
MSSNPLFELIIGTYKSAQGLTYDKVVDFIVNGPQHYSQWWNSLLKNAPEHIILETGLILFIIWLMFIRKTVDPVKASKNNSLSKKEMEWLVETWEPESLVPAAPSANDENILDSMLVRNFCLCSFISTIFGEN